MRLENWAVVAVPLSSFDAPELWKQRLDGDVYNNSKFEDGTNVTTSPIVGKRDGKIVTASGSEYSLGTIRKEYEELYPDAFNRLMNSLEDV